MPADPQVVLAVDPGLVTGFARLFRATGYEGSWEMGHESFMDWARACIAQHGPNLVVVSERYTVQANRVGTPEWSIGQHYALEMLCRWHHATFVAQSPADAKSFATNALLKEVGWWHVGGEGHARDAARHLLLYAARASWYKGRGVVDASR